MIHRNLFPTYSDEIVVNCFQNCILRDDSQDTSRKRLVSLFLALLLGLENTMERMDASTATVLLLRC